MMIAHFFLNLFRLFLFLRSSSILFVLSQSCSFFLSLVCSSSILFVLSQSASFCLNLLRLSSICFVFPRSASFLLDLLRLSSIYFIFVPLPPKLSKFAVISQLSYPWRSSVVSVIYWMFVGCGSGAWRDLELVRLISWSLVTLSCQSHGLTSFAHRLDVEY